MEDTGASYDMNTSCEGSEDLNGKDASYRKANMISEPRTIVKQRIRGGLAPMRRSQ